MIGRHLTFAICILQAFHAQAKVPNFRDTVNLPKAEARRTHILAVSSDIIAVRSYRPATSAGRPVVVDSLIIRKGHVNPDTQARLISFLLDTFSLSRDNFNSVGDAYFVLTQSNIRYPDERLKMAMFDDRITIHPSSGHDTVFSLDAYGQFESYMRRLCLKQNTIRQRPDGEEPPALAGPEGSLYFFVFLAGSAGIGIGALLGFFFSRRFKAKGLDGAKSNVLQSHYPEGYGNWKTGGPTVPGEKAKPIPGPRGPAVDDHPADHPHQLPPDFLNVLNRDMVPILSNLLKRCGASGSPMLEIKAADDLLRLIKNISETLGRKFDEHENNLERFQKASEDAAERMAAKDKDNVALKKDIEKMNVYIKDIEEGSRKVNAELNQLTENHVRLEKIMKEIYDNSSDMLSTVKRMFKDGRSDEDCISHVLSVVLGISLLSISQARIMNGDSYDSDKLNIENLLHGRDTPVQKHVDISSVRVDVNMVAYYLFQLLSRHNVKGIDRYSYMGYMIG